MRTIGLVTTARSDWGIQRPVAAALRARDDVDLQIVAAGMHLATKFGQSIEQIIADGFEVAHRVDFLLPGDTPEAIGTSIGQGVSAFSKLFATWRPDLITVLGDRFDMFPAAVAATPPSIPIAHMHGGEATVGAFDDVLRHAMTKMAHIHLAATAEYARRIRQMGERPEHIHVVGAPGLDDLYTLEPVDADLLERDFGFRPTEANLLVVYHPETRAYEDTARHAHEVFAALDAVRGNIVIVRPNADPANRVVNSQIDDFCRRCGNARAAVNLPRRTFLSLMRAASVMVGNSSSGLLEAPSFQLPAVNIGRRQEGRVRAANVIDCEPAAGAISTAIETARSPRFVRSLIGLVNPYGDGHSGERIAGILATTPLGRELTFKGFADL